MLATVTWSVRVVVTVVAGVATFAVNPPHGGTLVVLAFAYAVSVVIVAHWVAHELTVGGHPVPLGSRWVPTTELSVLALVAGFATMAPTGSWMLAFTIMATLSATADAREATGWVVTGCALVAGEVGVVAWDAGTTAAIWLLLLLALSIITGRNRRSYLLQAQQSAQMLHQLEQLRAEQHRVAVLDERTRIAREIHDVLAHSLGALGIQVQAVRAVLEQGDVDRALGMLETAQRMTATGLTETRRAVEALRGDSARLDEQVDDLVATHRARHHVGVDLALIGEPANLPPEATVALVRIVQEALVNAAKHAPDTDVAVRLDFGEDRTTLTVSNPLVADPTPSTLRGVDGGYGLTGMRERLLLIGGTLDVGARDGQWVVAAEAPR